MSGLRRTGFGGGAGRKAADAGGTPGKVAKSVATPKPVRTVKLLPDAPCWLSGCPGWLKAPSLWTTRLSPKKVLQEPLGSSRHATVLLLRQASGSGTPAVAKQFDRTRLLANGRLHDKVLNEWAVHSCLSHPNIVPAYGAVEDKSSVTLLMEAQQGDLLGWLDERDRDVLTEDEARVVVADVLSGLAHMHEQGFVHRDVKPENVFAAPAAAGAGVWRLGDMGSAVQLGGEGGAAGLHLEGSPPFLSPEYAALWVAPPAERTAQRLREATSPKQDVWGVGALLYDMLLGHPPFSGPAGAPEPPMPALAAAIAAREPDPSPAAAAAAGRISPAAADLLAAALRKEPAARPSAEELLGHPWLAGG